jgi:uncharacterized integral membrane protein|tara:strand:- start:705 stop:1031 length:327 start_codon:yes stop_codon:yes gene_type:complete
MQKIRWFFLILMITLALALVFQNQEQVDIQLLFLKQSLPLSVLLISATTIGFLLGALLTASMLRKRKSKKKQSPREPSVPVQKSDKTASHRLRAKNTDTNPLDTASQD